MKKGAVFKIFLLFVIIFITLSYTEGFTSSVSLNNLYDSQGKLLSISSSIVNIPAPAALVENPILSHVGSVSNNVVISEVKPTNNTTSETAVIPEVVSTGSCCTIS